MVLRVLTTASASSQVEIPSQNLQPGDVGIVTEDVLVPPTYWPMARIISTSPGRDGHTRVVTLKTKAGVYKRPVNKLVFLVPQSDH